MSAYVVSEQADADLTEIIDYLSDQSWTGEDLGLYTLDRVFGACALLAEHPELGRVRLELGADLRSYLVDPYTLYYRSRDGVLTLLRVLHQRRDINRIFGVPASAPS